VRSTPGRGSTFTVTLPLAAGATGAGVPDGVLEGRSVLLTCGTPALREHLARQLRAWGAAVVVPPAPWPLPEPGQIDVAVVDARTDDAPYCDRLVALAARTPVVLLTQPGRPVADGAPGCLELTVPARPERLEAALAALIGVPAPEAPDGGAAPGEGGGPPARRLPPAARSQSDGVSPHSRARPAVPGAVPRRVLVAEDNPVNQRIAAAMLTKLGHQVDVVGTGREAVDAAQLVGYDVVLMDCQMPEMDGWEATATLRSIPATSALPVIALTASATTEVREACLRAGMDGYLAKPVRLEELREAIEAVTAGGHVTR